MTLAAIFHPQRWSYYCGLDGFHFMNILGIAKTITFVYYAHIGILELKTSSEEIVWVLFCQKKKVSDFKFWWKVQYENSHIFYGYGDWWGSTLTSQDYSPSSVFFVPKLIRAIWCIYHLYKHNRLLWLHVNFFDTIKPRRKESINYQTPSLAEAMRIELW